MASGLSGIGLDWILNPAFGSLPLLLLAIGAIIVIAFGYMYKAKIALFKWSRCIEAPSVFNYEGGNYAVVRDKLRKTEDGGRTYFESKEFGDVFDATNLSRFLRYKKGGRLGRKRYELLPVCRVAKDEWYPMTFERDDSGKVVVKQAFLPEARIALATMREKNKEFLLNDDFWSKYGAILSVAVVGVVMLVSLIVITQFVGGVLNTSTQSLTAATNTLAQSLNCSAHATPIPTPR